MGTFPIQHTAGYPMVLDAKLEVIRCWLSVHFQYSTFLRFGAIAIQASMWVQSLDHVCELEENRHKSNLAFAFLSHT